MEDEQGRRVETGMPPEFSMHQYWIRRFAGHVPKLSFQGSTRMDWEAWKAEAMPRLVDLMGDFPEKAPLHARIEGVVEDGDLILERVVFDTERFVSVPAWVLRRKDLPAGKRHAAILCSHGHGRFGKDPVAGRRDSPGHVADIDAMNYDYAAQMALQGFVTMAPDLRGFGERYDPADVALGHDACDLNYVKGSMLGVYPLTLIVHDMKACVDYLETRPEVDPARIGMMGLSQGGTTTTFTAALEPRIRAADIIGYVNPWAGFGLDRGNYCGSQVVPGIYRWFDTHDIAGLIAPRPLLLEMGRQDTCFFIEDLLKGFEGVERIYRAAGVPGRLEADIGEGGHAFVGKKAPGFFRTHLLG
jgi:hypothetical protein